MQTVVTVLAVPLAAGQAARISDAAAGQQREHGPLRRRH